MSSLDNHSAGTPQGTLLVHLLGLVDFDSCLLLQDCLVYELSGPGNAGGVVLMCEHPPRITIGREGSRADVLLDDEELAARELTITRVARGGGTVLTVPGQLNVYVVLPVRQRKISPQRLRDGLLQCLWKLFAELHIPGEVDRRNACVFNRLGRLAFVGAAVRNGVSCFGVQINVNVDLRWFRMLRTHKHENRLTSCSLLRERHVSMSMVREALTRQLVEEFGFAQQQTLTGHPLLNRTRRRLPRIG